MMRCCVFVIATACSSPDDTSQIYVRATSPADGARDVAPRDAVEVTLELSAPVSARSAVARVTTGGASHDLELVWRDEDTISLPLHDVIEPAREIAIDLPQLVDDDGNAIGVPADVVTGALEFHIAQAAETRVPQVVTSMPTADEVGVYPAQVYDGTSQRVRIIIDVDEPLEPLYAFVAWGRVDAPATRLPGELSMDGRRFTANITSPPFSGQRPLADATTYELDLSSLRDGAWNRLAPAQQRLRFTTGTYDALLNHSCGHVALGPFATVTAGPAPSPANPSTDAGHTRYTVKLPAGAAGFTRARAIADASWHLFTDGQVPIRITRDGVEVPTATRATPHACDGITHVITADVDALASYVLEIPSQPGDEARFIFEVVQ